MVVRPPPFGDDILAPAGLAAFDIARPEVQIVGQGRLTKQPQLLAHGHGAKGGGLIRQGGGICKFEWHRHLAGQAPEPWRLREYRG
ncbi:hypothetical protein C9E82_15470 [Paracoccus siganidrum]|uniref:Uncharacterized protein n=1 Tax=Paracoccus siganidrum TaxID=1276757 RepID=A0A419ABD1_9RHOB|nr:hypothetical protein D3P05_02605 [Paracoccus siganidrum]RMC31942.1 hypothetical protein C9E82_15470 [Paracoccus siganidrum]